MLVDDSAVIRGLFTRALESDPELQIVASVGDGRMAISALRRHEVDVMVLDIEMPNLDGLSALPLLLEIKPDLPIVMASTLTRRNAEVSLKALAAGAKDYVTKPSSTSELTSAQVFRDELIRKIKALAGGRRGPREGRPPAPTRLGAAARPSVPSSATARTDDAPRHLGRPGEVTLRSTPIQAPEVLAIGSSTGGPQALFTVLGALGQVRQPILITQHMPATFTTILAEHIHKVTQRPCAEAKDGEAIQPAHIYVAPGDFHMLVEGHGAQRVLRLSKAPPENFCRPAVDPMLRSIAQSYGGAALCAILTGMGSDGTKGAQALVAAGGAVIAQDEASSVVWGMPGSAAHAGVCHAVLPLAEIASFLARHAQKVR
jgi:two-component system chemotaxis response regulator CheB